MTNPNLLMIGDFGKDLDDENALLYAIGAQKYGHATLSAVVANLAPEEQRARLVIGMLDVLKTDTPVGLGTSVFDTGMTHDYETEVPYLSTAPPTRQGTDLLASVLSKSADKSQSLVLNSGLTDAALLIDKHPDLARRKLSQVAIMGGVLTDNGRVVLSSRGRMVPDDAANNSFDIPAAVYVYDWLQAQHIPLSILTRRAAYDCYFGFDFYAQLAATDNPVGMAIAARHKPATNNLWLAVNSPEGSAERGRLPARCDRAWFTNAYLGGHDPGKATDVWSAAYDYGRVNLYDPLNVASVVAPQYFDPTIVNVNGTRHQVIGVSHEQTGIRDAAGLRSHLLQLELGALVSTIL